ncbi:MAG: hypothetical protein Fur0025_39020 [Oscillatoriaceae cyanobacterium]
MGGTTSYSYEVVPPTKELAAVNRRDAVQHPFLDDLYQWANSLRFYEFGTQLGKNVIAHIPQKVDFLKDKTDFKDYDYVVGIFCLGKNEIGDKFIQAIIDDRKEIGYEISEIGIKIPDDIMNMMPPESSENLPQFLYVKESDLNSVTEQSDMSQEMFRCLSLLIQTNYSLLSGKPSCIIIDDIGEGLDYQRSSAIIKFLLTKLILGLFN